MWIRIAAINGFLAVAGGALAAHALRRHLDEAMLAAFQTAARYQMYHALALLGVALLRRRTRSRAVVAAGWAFLIGIVLFSGSLYALALSGARWLGMVTPLGGVALLIGWLMLLFAPVRRRRPHF